MRIRNVKNAQEILDSNSDIVITNPVENKGNWNRIFGNNNPIHIEIGCGKGRYLSDLAVKYPNINFIGIEKVNNVLVRAVEKFSENKLDNVRFISYDALTLDEVFEDKEVEIIYLNFSDPWPKDRHAKRRLTSERFLNVYKKIMNDKLIMKTDSISLFEYSVKSFENNEFTLTNVTNDLHSLNEDNIMTEYEEKFSNKGFKINRLIATYKKSL